MTQIGQPEAVLPFLRQYCFKHKLKRGQDFWNSWLHQEEASVILSTIVCELCECCDNHVSFICLIYLQEVRHNITGNNQDGIDICNKWKICMKFLDAIQLAPWKN